MLVSRGDLMDPKHKLNAYVPQDIYKQLKIYAVEHDTSVSAIVENLIKRLLSGEIKLNK